MHPSKIALIELKRLESISQNKNPTNWEKDNNEILKVSSLNCRSLKKHFQDILTDEVLLKSDFIGLQEIWLNNDESEADLEIPGYNLHINSNGKGKGIASYYKKEVFFPVKDVKKTFMQLSHFSSSTVDIIVLYRSQQGHMEEMNEHLQQMLSEEKPQLIIGDFNHCYLNKASNSTRNFLEINNFRQLIMEPTHIEGNILDQAYMRDVNRTLEITGETHSKYYTDHKGIALMIKNVRNKAS